jgi:hypothetical protein
VGLQRVYSDYLSYLFGHTRTYLSGLYSPDPWLEQGGQAEIILTCPNQLNEAQRNFLREAIVAAGILPANAINNRLHFVEESEAIISFCLATKFSISDMNIAVRP